MRYRTSPSDPVADQTALAAVLDAPRRFVLGTNDDGRAVADVLPIDGWVDDYLDATTHEGLPVVRTAELPTDAAVISCVTNARPHTALQRLHAASPAVVTDVLTMARASGGAVPAPAFVRASRAAYLQDHAAWDAVADLFADETSKQVFDAISSYRLEGDLRHTRGFTFRPEEQYFEPFTAPRAGEVFVDGGAYDGTTTEAFLERCPDHGGVHVFEPVPDAMATTQTLLAGHDRIHLHRAGLHDHAGQLRIRSALGSASTIADDGDLVIDVVRLDDVEGPRPTFIKLDLEGAEPAALRGMEQLLRRGDVRLAVAGYHEPDHLWRIPAFVLGCNPDYEVRLRHYTESWTESVLYFTP